MTRKKWNKLRRQRPELFTKFVKSSWESLPSQGMVMGNLRKCSRAQAVAALTAFILSFESHPSAPERALIHKLKGAPVPYSTLD